MAERILGIVPHKTNDLELNDLATKIFTVGGIDITTNLEPTSNFDRLAPSFSQFFSLNSLPVNTSPVIRDGNSLVLNYDKSNPKYFARFGSMLELVRVSLDNIILKYPAAIHSKENIRGIVGDNVLSSIYFPYNNTTTFTASVNYFSNPFGIYYLDNLSFVYSDDRINKIRNLTQNYIQYELVVDDIAYPILSFTPSSKETNDVIKLKVLGDPFESGSSSKDFYIKPIEAKIIDFYNNIGEFEGYLLNPKNNYNAIFEATHEVDGGGVVILYSEKFQFPKLDNYNIDVTSRNYEVYVDDLIDFATNYDETEGNLLMRHLTPDNIQSVTLESVDSLYPTYGKINKVLIVYGREIDKINRYIENIKFFNTVTYNKKDNIPDALITSYANNLGWEVSSPENIDSEVWRLLIVNSWWVWKSKGTRSAIEFILEYMGIPMDIVDFNEYIIRAKKPIDMNQLTSLYNLFSENIDLSELPIDSDGYPIYPEDTNADYFQKSGLNDGGLGYFMKWLNLLPVNFTGNSISSTVSNASFIRLFEQDFDGTGNTLGYNVVNGNLVDNLCYSNSGKTISDPYPTPILDICGCPLPISDKALKIDVQPNDLTSGCTNIILDIYYECTSISGATLFIKSYGGVAPITLSGATNGQSVISGETIEIFATDSKGCTSSTYEVTINCIDPCLGTYIVVDLDYNCILDSYGQNTGQAIVSLSASGGVAPYTYIGVQNGDTVNDAEIISVEVIDSEGCSSGLVGLTVDCEPPATVTCSPITLNSTLETTNVEVQDKSAKVNVTYDLIGLPSGLFISSVTLNTVGVGGDNAYVVGTPISTVFNSDSGADTISLDFTPSEVQNSISLDVSIEVILSNGCTYTHDFTSPLTVNPQQLGNADFYDAILTI